MKTVVVIPTYNERDNIGDLTDQILAVHEDIHVLIVDDQSPDGTAQAVKEHPLYGQRVFLIRREGRRGRGLADFDGLKEAVTRGYDYILQMDADFSHSTQDIPRFLKEIQRHDVVIGSRRIKGGRSVGRAQWRDLLTPLANFYIRCLIGFQIKDWTSGFRCYRRRVLASIHLEDMISVAPSSLEEILYACARRGYDIYEIPIIYIDRKKGRSKVNLSLFWDVFVTVFKIRFLKKHV